MKACSVNVGFFLILAVILAACGISLTPPVRIGPSSETPFPTVAPFIETTPLPAVELSKTPGADFGFSLQFGACYSEMINTFDGTFTRDLRRTTGGKQETIPLELSRVQIVSVYEKIRAINLFSYPEAFTIPKPVNGSVQYVTPSMKYQFIVLNGSLTRKIAWTDDIVQPTTIDADNLRTLFKMIVEMVQEHPGYKKLAPPKFGCA